MAKRAAKSKASSAKATENDNDDDDDEDDDQGEGQSTDSEKLVGGETITGGEPPEGEQPGGEYVTVPVKEGEELPGDTRLDVESQTGDDKAETDEEKRARRRQEKKDRRERQRTARMSQERELAGLRRANQELTQQVQGVTTRLSNQDRVQLDDRARQLKRDVAEATDIVARAMTAGDAAALSEAMAVRDDLNYELRNVQAFTQRVGAMEGSQPATTVSAAAPNPAVQRRVVSFEAAHPWYDPVGGDEDSALVREIDNAVVREGYHPATAAYWDELEQRIKKNLPQRFDDDDDNEGGGGDGRQRSPGPRGPGTVTTRGSGAGSPGTFYVTPERRQAMIDGGIWDDAERRAKQIKAYMAYDIKQAEQRP